MAQRCTICSHPDREAIEKALVAGIPNRRIAGQFSVAETSLRRHAKEHLPQVLAEGEEAARQATNRRGKPAHTAALIAAVRQQQAAAEAHAIDLLAELTLQLQRARLLSDAIHDYLTDPEDATRYNIGPRAGDVIVTYLVPMAVRGARAGERDTKWVPRKASLAALLAEIHKAGLPIEKAEFRIADPRKLLLDTAGQLGSTIELLASLIERVHNAAEVERFQTAVLDAVGEAAPDVREAVERALRRRQPLLQPRQPR